MTNDPRVRTRARELAVDGVLDHAIVAKLSDELALDYDDVGAWADVNAAQLERWRHVGEADLAVHLQAIADGRTPPVNGTQLSLLVELGRQRLGWSRDSVPEQVNKGVQKAKRDAGKSGAPKLKVAG